MPSGRGRSPIWRRRPLGGITGGIYPTSAPGEVRHLLQYGGAALIVVEDQEHLQDARGARCDFRNLRRCRLEEFPPADTGITSIEHYAQETDPQY